MGQNMSATADKWQKAKVIFKSIKKLIKIWRFLATNVTKPSERLQLSENIGKSITKLHTVLKTPKDMKFIRDLLNSFIVGVLHSLKKATCDLCGKDYSKIRLIDHMKNVHLRIGKQVCNICDFRTLSQIALKNHRVSHGLLQRCSIWRDFTEDIEKHVRSHRVKRRRKQSCNIC